MIVISQGSLVIGNRQEEKGYGYQRLLTKHDIAILLVSACKL